MFQIQSTLSTLTPPPSSVIRKVAPLYQLMDKASNYKHSSRICAIYRHANLVGWSLPLLCPAT